jgi:CubicO group peptidase (beta-lactamase class C family)
MFEFEFSSSKTLTAICIACMVDKGLLDYNEKVSTYWPEFAQNGKENLKLCDVLR